MIYKEIKSIKIPVIGFGTYRIQDSSIISTALKAGYRHIDTARSYFNEQMVGEAVAASGLSRDDVFITTKIWHDRLKPQQVYEDIDDSLKKLKSDYVDLLLIHWPSTEGVPLEDTLDAFEKIREAGKAKAIGVSNFPLKLLQKAVSLAGIFCNQVEYHPFLGQQELLIYCKEQSIALTAYRPIAKNSVAENEVLRKIAAKYNKTPAQVSLRWLIQQEPVVAIPRSSKTGHIQSNLQIFDFELSKEEMQDIHALDQGQRQVNPAFAPEW